MHLSLKIVVVLLVCGVMLSDTQGFPPAGRKKQDGPQGPDIRGNRNKPTPPRIPGDVRGARKFCGALVNGNIKNDNATFNDVFTSATSVCKDVNAWSAANKPPAEGDELSEGNDINDNKDKSAVRVLLRVCRGMDKKIPVDDSTPKPIRSRFDAVCEQAKKLAGPGAETP
ncbi:uncharacterized protein LOC127866439 isoform X2 [Dreissena polymorpha]|uniref:Uncharacterized protein n=1 Tax=Dreissena polymorpha TaxID=45954 RepID=A0A9D4RE62_DREPO|nr:uncharacterized protein LOC127866439 isoform X2 [Dreissena polymorpha]KAH3863040.1 hypothetical protein DPMN_026016 [Dreissena polymorpha]